MGSLIQPSIDLAIVKVCKFEGFSSNPYLDDRKPPVPTIGYGTTIYPNGNRVTLQDKPCTQSQALIWLEHDLHTCVQHMWAALTVQPTLNQWSAILSLAYNEGWFPIQHSTLIRLFNAKQTMLAANQFPVWDKLHHDGELVESKGLKNRREAERALFLTPDNVYIGHQDAINLQ